MLAKKLLCIWIVLILMLVQFGRLQAQSSDSDDGVKQVYMTAQRLFEQGLFLDAATLWETVESRSPGYLAVREYLFNSYRFAGIELYNHNRHADAIAIWQKALTLEPGNDEVSGYVRRAASELHKLGELSGDSTAITPAPIERPVSPSAKDPDPDNQRAKADATRIRRLSDSLRILSDRLAATTVIEGRTPVLAEDSSTVQVSGYVAASVLYDRDAREADFNLDEAEIDVTRSLDNRAVVRIDMECRPDADDDLQARLEQGFITYAFDRSRNWSITAGKFNIPIGLEPLEAPERYLYSNSSAYEYGTPENGIGAMLTFGAADILQWQTYVVNGWDVNDDNNRDKTIGVRIGISPSDWFELGLSTIYGPELDDNVQSDRTVFDVDLTIEPSNSVRIGAELNYGRESDVITDEGEVNWLGIVLIGEVSFAEKYRVAGRLDYFDDTDGSRSEIVQEITTIAISPSVWLVDGLYGRAEIGFQIVDVEFEESQDRLTSALSLYYSF